MVHDRTDPARADRWTHEGYGPFAAAGTAAGLAAAIAVLLALFQLLPGLDIAAAGLFFAATPCPAEAPPAAVCGVFPMRESAPLAVLREVLQVLPIVLAAMLLALIVRRAWAGVLPATSATYEAPLAAIGTLILGPGLLVNGLLKEYSGRPRPMQTDLFGGDLAFMPAGRFSTLCHDNCSFVSGEASTAFWLLCLLPMLPRLYRNEMAAGIVTLVLVMTGLRVAFGAHYPSDVLIGGLSTLLVHALIARAAASHRRARLRAAAA